MARPERKTVDYFPHYISDGKKMFYIQQKYGNGGYATWFKVLESLASTDNHFLNLNSEMDLMFLSAKCMVSKEVLLSILDDLSILKEIDHFLWMNKIVYSQKFIESIQDAYIRRTNKCYSYEGLCKHLIGLCTTITLKEYEKKYINTQTILYNIKPKEKKENNIPEISEFLDYVKTIPEFSQKFESLKFAIESKYESWVENGWKDGHGKEIKNWKSKLKNTLPYLKPIFNNQNYGPGQPTKSKAEILNDDLKDWIESFDDGRNGIQSNPKPHDRVDSSQERFEDYELEG